MKGKIGCIAQAQLFEIFEPKLLRTTVVATILSACAYAAAFGTLQVTVTQAVPGLPDMAETRTKMEPLIKANKGLENNLQASIRILKNLKPRIRNSKTTSKDGQN